MSYRAFKRLLGETSLERKCRFLFGGFILLLIVGSFSLYLRQTEHLAYDQIINTGRLLVIQIMDRKLATVCRPVPGPPPAAAAVAAAGSSAAPGGPAPLLAVVTLASAQPPADERPDEPARQQTASAQEEFRTQWENHWPEALRDYHYRTLRPNAVRADNKPADAASAERLRQFQNDRSLQEDTQGAGSPDATHYYGAVRAGKTCLECHRRTQPDLQEGDLIAVIKVEVPTKLIENGVQLNRALLISTGLVTALLIMGGSFVLVRYVIVKPVKHLKEVSDAISAGELNVRSEIQTGDEFEDLSHAFNRMLRNLVSMQDRLRKVNADLDRKVDELAHANLALYESNRLKSDFLATMSHELRTPLNSILGFSQVLQSSPGLNDKQTRWVNNIRSSGEQLLALINDILDLAKIEAGKMEVRVSEFSSYDVCEGLLTMFRPLAEKKNIDLRGQFAPDIPPLRQDPVKFQQILSNLLSNAVKFTPEGGRVLLKAETEGDRMVLQVIDTGVGIAPEEQELVFEKFRQGANPLTRDYAGTGLGLSIVRELTKLLGGEVTLQSELGRGSTFTVRLPLHRSEEPRLEFNISLGGIDLAKAQRIDPRLYGPAPTA
jgi:two-component system, NarL family, sensor histidine kinase BarA